MKVEIKHRYSGVLWSGEAEDLREGLQKAIAAKVNLRDSNLHGSNLSGADLRGADLRGADLRGANLSYSDLHGSDLSDSDLRGSNLRGADLHGSDLSYSNLRGSNLSDSNLRGSNLSDSNLRDSNLSGADLGGADLSDSESGSVCRLDFGGWSICIRADKTSIGCQTQLNIDWLKWTPKDVAPMDDKAEAWWKLHGPAVKAAIRVVMEKARVK